MGTEAYNSEPAPEDAFFFTTSGISMLTGVGEIRDAHGLCFTGLQQSARHRGRTRPWRSRVDSPLSRHRPAAADRFLSASRQFDAGFCVA